MPNSVDSDQKPPPGGDITKASQYLEKLGALVDQDKITVFRTDLSKFDPSALEDHYRIDLQDYRIEISHSKQPNTGTDSYVILFNNLQNVAAADAEKAILAYLILTAEQYKQFQSFADSQIERRKKMEEEKRFNQAMAPIDQLLIQYQSGNPPVKPAKPAEPEQPKVETPAPPPATPEPAPLPETPVVEEVTPPAAEQPTPQLSPTPMPEPVEPTQPEAEDQPLNLSNVTSTPATAEANDSFDNKLNPNSPTAPNDLTNAAFSDNFNSNVIGNAGTLQTPSVPVLPTNPIGEPITPPPAR